MKLKKIKTKFGGIRFFETKEASFNIETLNQCSKTPKLYLKNNEGYLIMLDGNIRFGNKKLKRGDFIKIKKRHIICLENKTNKKAKYLAIDIPPVKKGDLIFLK